MIVGIMQPYLFPYIDYFQLIAHCDVFILLDDAQHIERGWVNRNRILMHGAPAWISLPVHAASHTLAINQRHYDLKSGGPAKILRRIEAAYCRAPFVDRALPVVARIMAGEESNVADFNARAICELVTHLGIDTRIVRSSHMLGVEKQKSVHWLLAICKEVGASAYVNPAGGMKLYAPGLFAEAGIELRFLEAIPHPYTQFSPQFVPFLSIIDVMMHNDATAMKNRLAEYRIIEPLRLP